MSNSKKTNREATVELIKDSMKYHEKIGITGGYGSGKSYLITLLKEKASKKEKIIEINAYESYGKNDSLLEYFINKIKKKKISKKLHFSKTGYGKWIKKMDRIASILMGVVSGFLLTSFSILHQNNPNNWEWLLFGLAMLFMVMGIISLFLGINIHDYWPDELTKFKFNKKNKEEKKVIFIIEDLNRLEAEEQSHFFNKINYYFDELKNINNKKIIFLFDRKTYENNKDDDLTKFLDCEIAIINDDKIIREVIEDIILTDEKISFKSEIIKDLNTLKMKSIYSGEITYMKYIVDSEQFKNIRKIILFLEKYDYYLKYNLFIKSAWKKDVLDFILLEFLFFDLYREIIANPNIIFENNSYLNAYFNAYQSSEKSKITTFGEEILSKDSNYTKFKEEYKFFAWTIFRKQEINRDGMAFDIKKEFDDCDQKYLRISNYKDFYFFKFPERFEEYLSSFKNIELLFESNEVNINKLIELLMDKNSPINLFKETDIKMCLDIILTNKNIDLKNGKMFNEIFNQLINLNFESTYSSSNSDNILDSLIQYFLEYFNYFVGKKMVNLWVLGMEKWNLIDYQFSFIISNKLRGHIKYDGPISTFLKIDWGLIFKDGNASNKITSDKTLKELEKIDDFYEKCNLNHILFDNAINSNSIDFLKLDNFLTNIYVLSNKKINKFIKNILNLDKNSCRLLIFSMYESNLYSELIKTYLKKINKKSEIFELIRRKGKPLYDEINSYLKNHGDDKEYRLQNKIFIDFCKEYKVFFK